jgi:hypothetical protein
MRRRLLAAAVNLCWFALLMLLDTWPRSRFLASWWAALALEAPE